jgi:DNA-binding NarL/FixJ family response regulator
MHDKTELVHQAIQNGARGYILKASIYDELESAVRAVAQGQLYHSAVVDNYLEVFLFTGGDIPLNPLDQLTGREREVLGLLAEGLRSNEIAEVLSLSKRTVDRHRSNIMEKLDAQTPIELGRIYARYGRVFDSS